MVKSCRAVGCTNRFLKGSGRSFYPFPKSKVRMTAWANAIRRKNRQPTNSSYVCSDHFARSKKSDDKLSPDFIPSVFRVGDRERGEKVFVTCERRKKREVARQLGTHTVSIEEDDGVEAGGANKPHSEGAASGVYSVSCQTSLSLSDLQSCYMQLEIPRSGDGN